MIAFVKRIASLAAVGAVSVALCGCPLAHPDYPDRSCKLSSDCFHDEICSSNVCISVDAGAPDLATPVDLASLGDAE